MVKRRCSLTRWLGKIALLLLFVSTSFTTLTAQTQITEYRSSLATASLRGQTYILLRSFNAAGIPNFPAIALLGPRQVGKTFFLLRTSLTNSTNTFARLATSAIRELSFSLSILV